MERVITMEQLAAGFRYGVAFAGGIFMVVLAVVLLFRLYEWVDYRIYWALRRREARKKGKPK